MLNVKLKRVDIRPRIDIEKSMQYISKNAVQYPCKHHGICTKALVRDGRGLALHCKRPYCTAMATIRRPHCALLERCGNAKPWRLF